MFIMLCDETHKPGSPGSFFCYGGVVFPINSVSHICGKIEQWRKRVGLGADDCLKFRPKSLQKNVTLDVYYTLQSDVIKLCSESDCKLITSLVHKDILKKKHKEEYVFMGANKVIGQFNYHLRMSAAYGICLMDRVEGTNHFKHLSDLSHKGLEFPKSGTTEVVRLDRVLVFGVTADGLSHLASATDIVIGHFHSICTAASPIKNDTPSVRRQLGTMLDCVRGDKGLWSAVSLMPKNRDSYSTVKQDYDKLKERIKDIFLKKSVSPAT
jgi:hypothetical protein